MPSTKLGLDLIGMYLFYANIGEYENSAKLVPFGEVTINGIVMEALGKQQRVVVVQGPSK